MRRIFTLLLGLCLSSSFLMAQAETFDVFTLDDSGIGSLRQAILDANANGNEATDTDIINIQVSGTITLTTEDAEDINLLPRLANITLNGNQITLARGANALGRFFQLDSGSLVRGITFDGGNSRLTGGAVFLASNTTVENCLFINNSAGNLDLAGEGSGGALRTNNNSVNVVVEGSTFTNNRAQRGAAIWNGFNANIVISNCTFTGNTVDPQTFVDIPAVVYNQGTASLTGNIIFNQPLPAGTVDYYDSGNTTIVNVDNLIGSIGGAGSGMAALAGGVASTDDPMLGPLQDNGGATLTFAPTAASPAVVQSIALANPPQQVVVPPLQPETIELIEMLEREAEGLPTMNIWGLILMMLSLLGLGSYLLFSNKMNLWTK